nr:uncharacterized protein LOC109174068 [Ipomoea trifida]
MERKSSSEIKSKERPKNFQNGRFFSGPKTDNTSNSNWRPYGNQSQFPTSGDWNGNEQAPVILSPPVVLHPIVPTPTMTSSSASLATNTHSVSSPALSVHSPHEPPSQGPLPSASPTVPPSPCGSPGAAHTDTSGSQSSTASSSSTHTIPSHESQGCSRPVRIRRPNPKYFNDKFIEPVICCNFPDNPDV